MRKLPVTLFLSFSLLTACATHKPELEGDDVAIEPTEQTEEVSANNPNATQPSQPARPAEVSRIPPAVNIATDSLTAMARQQYQSGQYQSAIATAERGLRIDRRAAGLYLVLAQSYLQLQMPQQAKNFTLQGLRYAVQGSDVENSLVRIKNYLKD